MSSIVTYDVLFEMLRVEKNEASLQKLSETFFSDVRAYFAQKRDVLERVQKNSSLFHSDQSDALEHELRNARKVLAEICNRREKKIVMLAQQIARSQMQQHDLSALLTSERELFSKMLDLLTSHRSILVDQLSEQSTPPVQEAQVKYVFTSDVSEFIGPDLEHYGPFKQNDVASIPQMVASVLLDRGQIRVAQVVVAQ